MDFVLIIVSLLFAALGVIGAVVPVLPGPPLSYVGLLIMLCVDGHDISTTTLVVTGILAVVITVIDYVLPVWFTKRAGGSKSGVWGATIGLFIGLFMGFVGVLIGPFLGAFIGELIAETPVDKALKVAFFSFLAFIVTTGLKLIYGVVLFAMIWSAAWSAF